MAYIVIKTNGGHIRYRPILRISKDKKLMRYLGFFLYKPEICK